MKVKVAIFGALMALTSIAAEQQSTPWEAKLGGEYLFPGSTTWDSAIGTQGQMIYRWTTGLGIGLSAGLQQWSINEDIRSYGGYFYGTLPYGYATHMTGDATMFPIGLSGLYAIPIGGRVRIDLECGLRYIFVNSSVKESDAVVWNNGSYVTAATSQSDVDIGNGLVGFAGINVDVKLTDMFKLFAGGGYQLDISKGDMTYNSLENSLSDAYSSLVTTETSTTSELKAAFARAGLSVTW